MNVSILLSLGLTLCLLTAHVTHEVASEGDSFPPWYFITGGCVFAILAFVDEVRPTRTSYRPVAYALTVAGCSAAAAAFDVLEVFAVAYTLTPLILMWLQLLHARTGDPLVLYDPTTPDFVLTRSLSYALLRSLSQLLVRHVGVPIRLTRLFPFIVASIETAAMATHSTSASYAFTIGSCEFAVYVALKSAVFLGLPLLEDALRA